MLNFSDEPVNFIGGPIKLRQNKRLTAILPVHRYFSFRRYLACGPIKFTGRSTKIQCTFKSIGGPIDFIGPPLKSSIHVYFFFFFFLTRFGGHLIYLLHIIINGGVAQDWRLKLYKYKDTKWQL